MASVDTRPGFESRSSIHLANFSFYVFFSLFLSSHIYYNLSGTLYYCYWYRYCVIVYVFYCVLYCVGSQDIHVSEYVFSIAM